MYTCTQPNIHRNVPQTTRNYHKKLIRGLLERIRSLSAFFLFCMCCWIWIHYGQNTQLAIDTRNNDMITLIFNCDQGEGGEEWIFREKYWKKWGGKMYLLSPFSWKLLIVLIFKQNKFLGLTYCTVCIVLYVCTITINTWYIIYFWILLSQYFDTEKIIKLLHRKKDETYTQIHLFSQRTIRCNAQEICTCFLLISLNPKKKLKKIFRKTQCFFSPKIEYYYIPRCCLFQQMKKVIKNNDEPRAFPNLFYFLFLLFTKIYCRTNNHSKEKKSNQKKTKADVFTHIIVIGAFITHN